MVNQLLRVFALFVELVCTKSEHLNNNQKELFRLPSKENPQSKRAIRRIALQVGDFLFLT